MTQNKQRRSPLPLLCAAAVAASLALPPAVFALWDKALLAAPHSQELPADSLAEAACDDPTACLLYDAAHLLNIYVGSGADKWGGWTQAEPTEEHRKQLADTLDTLREAGLVDDVLLPAELPGEEAFWEVFTAPGGLVSCNVWEERDAETAWYLHMIYTPQGRPVFFSFDRSGTQIEQAVRPGTAAAYRDLLQLDGFDDWQTVEWNGRLADAGETMYSAQAQLYLTANYRTGVALSVISMTPQEFAALMGKSE